MSGTHQAVIVIHGMGEQRPMTTLRSFAEAAIPQPADPGDVRYRSKPDDVSKSFELRRYDVPSTGNRPATHLYEFYWADKMTGTKLRHLLPLMRALMLRWPWKIRGSVRPFWVIGWIVLAAVGLVVVMTIAQRGPLALLDSPGDLLSRLFGSGGPAGQNAGVEHSTVAGWLTLLAVLMLGTVQGFVIGSFGDVARYLDNKPGNVGVRHDIKAAARDVLKALHESGRYDRIVIVGHSLGSIIGLDMITNYWALVHDQHGRPATFSQDKLEALEALGPTLTPDQVEAYQAAQRDLWVEQRSVGVPWLVTDFVSVGSPLSHADWLMSSGRSQLMERFERSELLHNPPQIDDPRPYSFPNNYTSTAGPRTLFVLHHGAAFACTRWTNIWFPTKIGLFGDPFGGPLTKLFGPGIVDHPVTDGPRWVRRIPILAHVRYWRNPDPMPGTEHPSGHHITLLRDALDLDSDDWL
jgi:hypothetical protein